MDNILSNIFTSVKAKRSAGGGSDVRKEVRNALRASPDDSCLPAGRRPSPPLPLFSPQPEVVGVGFHIKVNFTILNEMLQE
jgi:hypothetical protein